MSCNKMRFRLLQIAAASALMLRIALLSGQFGGGDGTADNPYLVQTPEHLHNIRNFLEADFLQTADIDLSGEWSEGAGWNPLGDADNRFSGSYDGDGYRITGLTIDRETDHTGLFGYVMNGRIAGVNLFDIDIQGNDFVGGIAGLAAESGIEQSTVIGSISGNSQVGGIAGFLASETTVSECFVDVAVSGSAESSFVGGAVGVNFDDSVIINSYSHANVRGNSQMIGGLIGWNFLGIVINSYSTGAVGATAVDPTQIGGLVGDDALGQGTFTNSYWDMETSGRNLSARGLGRTTQQMTYRYADNTYEDWDFAEIWEADQEHRFNSGYPYLSFQEFVELDTPEIEIAIEEIAGQKTVVITWEQIEDANSYRIYASYNPYAANWGEPVDTVPADENRYTEPVGERGKRFYRVTASILGP